MTISYSNDPHTSTTTYSIDPSEVRVSPRFRGFEEVAAKHKTYPENVEIKLPAKATKSSVGYDWYAPVDIDIPPQTTVKIMTDIKAYMKDGEALILAPRSSTGIKHDLMIANTLGIGESDFYENVDNDGNYCIALRNLRPETKFLGFVNLRYKHLGCPMCIEIPDIEDLRKQNTVHIKAGDRIIQGFFIQTLPADSGDSEAVREGGVGSTGQ